MSQSTLFDYYLRKKTSTSNLNNLSFFVLQLILVLLQTMLNINKYLFSLFLKLLTDFVGLLPTQSLVTLLVVYLSNDIFELFLFKFFLQEIGYEILLFFSDFGDELFLNHKDVDYFVFPLLNTLVYHFCHFIQR